MPETSTLQELVMAAHFEPRPALTILDIADWAQAFREYPVALQLPVLPEVNLNSPGQIGVQLQFNPVVLPRLLLRTTSGDMSVQIQHDRFAVGWSRRKPVGELAEYPGYDAMKRRWTSALQKFRSWCEGRLAMRPHVRVVELTYHNATPMEVGSQRRSISEVFRWVQPGRIVNGFQVQWSEFLDNDRPHAGRVAGFVALGGVPSVEKALLFNFSGLGRVEMPGAEHEAARVLDALHERISMMYEGSIASQEGA